MTPVKNASSSASVSEVDCTPDNTQVHSNFLAKPEEGRNALSACGTTPQIALAPRTTCQSVWENEKLSMTCYNCVSYNCVSLDKVELSGL